MIEPYNRFKGFAGAESHYTGNPYSMDPKFRAPNEKPDGTSIVERPEVIMPRASGNVIPNDE